MNSKPLGRVALITTSDDVLGYDEVDIDEIEAELRAANIAPTRAVWHDPSVDWDAFDLLVVRCPWDYSERPREFLAWMDAVAAPGRFLNPPDVIRWNLDKTYLLELRDLGVPIVPTRVCHTPAEVLAAARAAGPTIVVKPTVSAGSKDTAMLDGDDPVVLSLAEKILGDGKAVMIQPAIPSVATAGETASIYFDGVLSHSVRKGPILELGGGFVGGAYTEAISATTPPPAVAALADQAMAAIRAVCAARFAIREPLLYARIDLVETPAGPQLLEAELFEPSYFVGQAPGSAARFASCVARRLTTLGEWTSSTNS